MASGAPIETAGSRPCLQVAPMMAWTDAHFRTLLRLITRRTLLYTEMLVADAVLKMTQETLVATVAASSTQRPLAVQLGGCDPVIVAAAARRCAELGIDEINLNCGCPSDAVSAGGFGASLMKNPALVQAICAAVRAAVPLSVAVTVKHRLGVDNCDSWAYLTAFVDAVSAPPASVRHFIVHARSAVLGLSTAANRAVPPLRHDIVVALAQAYPHLTFDLNGGVDTLDHAARLLAGPVHGVMVGRAAFHSPWMFADADRRFFGAENPAISRRWLVETYAMHAENAWLGAVAEAAVLPAGTRAGVLRRVRERLYQPALHLFAGSSCAVAFHARLVKAEQRQTGVGKALANALRVVPAAEADAPPTVALAPAQELADSVRAAILHTDANLGRLFGASGPRA